MDWDAFAQLVIAVVLLFAITYLGVWYAIREVLRGYDQRLDTLETTSDDHLNRIKSLETEVEDLDVRVAALEHTEPPPPTLWPFAASAPWNIPAATAIVLAGGDHETTRNLAQSKGNVNHEQWSVAVYHATEDDPWAELVGDRTSNTVHAFIPEGAHPTGGDDRHVFIVQPDGSGWDCYKFETSNDPLHYEAAMVVAINTLTGEGTYAGTRAARTPSLAGLILVGDVLEHALAVALPANLLRSGYVYPATQEDADSETSYTGTIPMGSRLLLKPGAPVGDDAHSQRLAKALRTYGAYVVDRGSTSLLYLELACSSQDAASYKSAWQALYPYMRVAL